MAAPRAASALLVAIGLFTTPVLGDGIGLIGLGKTMYNPTCAFACRAVVAKCTLLCTPSDDEGVNHGTMHNPVSTPPDCYVKDPAFLKTMAMCIDNYCPFSPNQGMPTGAVIESYWAKHLGTGSIATSEWTPIMSYHEALIAAREDEKKMGGPVSSNSSTTDHSGHDTRLKARHGHAPMDDDVAMSSPNVNSSLPVIKSGEPLNVTSFIGPKDWQLQYNGYYDFEANENMHSISAVIIAIIAIALPVLLSSLRFLQNAQKSYFLTSVKAAIIHPPLFGRHHREPITSLLTLRLGALMPNRGQAIFILLISILNITLLLVPFTATHPQAIFSTLQLQSLSIIGSRAGNLAMGNCVAMIVFATRNSPLSYITDWSRSTYLLLHRWLGYWTIFHSALHSVNFLAYYSIEGAYEDEVVRDYWVWGIVATVAVCAILPFSFLVVRQKAYEFFLATHIVLGALFLIGYYYHIWYCYEYDWGYEIWTFVACALWAVDWVVRFVRAAVRGVRTASVEVVEGTDGEYLHIQVEGVELRKGGYVYLRFPTLGLSVLESHPFSVASSTSAGGTDAQRTVPITGVSTTVSADKEKPVASEIVAEDASSSSSTRGVTTSTTASTSFFARVRSGMTAKLAKRAAAQPGSPLKLKVLVEGSYHDGAAPTRTIEDCDRLVCIAGGIGITALVPFLRTFSNSSSSDSDSTDRSAHLYWGVRKAGLIDVLKPGLDKMSGQVQVETSVGTRFDLEQVLRRELLPKLPVTQRRQCCKGKTPAKSTSQSGSGGEEKAMVVETKELDMQSVVGIVVCGPPGMADDVRVIVSRLTRQETMIRPYVFVDEAFNW